MRILPLLIALFFFMSAPLELRAADPSDISNTGDQQNATVTEDQRGTVLERAKESQARIKTVEKAAGEEALSLKQGGWLGSTYRQYQNIDNQKSLTDFLKWSWTQEAYWWLYLDYNRAVNAYLQIGDYYTDRGTGPTYTGVGSDNEGPFISMAYSKINLKPMIDVPLALTVCRQYLFLGRGLVYAAIDDGLLTEYTQYPFYLKQFVAVTTPGQDNIDFSVPGFDKNGERLFAGGELSYVGIKKTSVYAFAFLQKDNSTPDPKSLTQDFHYDSNYLGTGFSTTLWERLELWSEVAGEWGRSYTDTLRIPEKKTKIEAWAAMAAAKYRFDLPTKPILEAQFAHGSGDEDRTSVTNTDGGDLDGRDKNFLYFGYYQAGYALQPRLSNINIASLHASCQPLAQFPLFKKMALGVKYFFYWKDKAQGGTSDLQSTNPDAAVGQEVDIYIQWKIDDRLSLSARYGNFFPGDAFPEEKRNNTKYFYTRLTFSF